MSLSDLLLRTANEFPWNLLTRSYHTHSMESSVTVMTRPGRASRLRRTVDAVTGTALVAVGIRLAAATRTT